MAEKARHHLWLPRCTTPGTPPIHTVREWCPPALCIMVACSLQMTYNHTEHNKYKIMTKH